VQAKLLRALETREVMPLGAAHPQPVSVRVCAATLRDLRREVVAGRFREDLYYRVGRPVVRIPALGERLDELPFLARRVLRAVDGRLEPGAELVEQCALRPWPGNVRELVGELRHAAHAALAAGDTSAARFETYGAEFCQALEAMRRLVHAFYDRAFNFGTFLKAHPDMRGDLTDCLIGNLFRDFDPLFDAVSEFAEVPRALTHGKPAVGGS
jgi:transcriptional regulator of acetoin/glycerol metabolism